jgi:mRNA-degrading endonuclease RelE of RelBE toxin-antitoxin system
MEKTMQNRFDYVVDPLASKNRIVYSRKALKNFNQLNNQRLRDRIDSRIQQLAFDPYPPNSKKLQQFQNVWRIRCGSYRIWYEPCLAMGKITILWLGHHQDDFHHSNHMKAVA